MHFAGRTLSLLADPATAFGPIARTLSAADLAMVNLETAVTRRGTPAPKQFHFRAPPSAVAAVRAAGVDVVSLANNHVLDYGQVGLADTLHAARVAGRTRRRWRADRLRGVRAMDGGRSVAPGWRSSDSARSMSCGRPGRRPRPGPASPPPRTASRPPPPCGPPT